MMATGSHHTMLLATNANNAPSTTTLSASGSRNAPDRVVPCRRATQPSIPSVKERAPHTTKLTQSAPLTMMRAISSGVASKRNPVMPLAGVNKAEGPKVELRRGEAAGVDADAVDAVDAVEVSSFIGRPQPRVRCSPVQPPT